jgi:hypothetical protein
MLKVVPTKSEVHQDFELSLDDVASVGARRLLVQALSLDLAVLPRFCDSRVPSQVGLRALNWIS